MLFFENPILSHGIARKQKSLILLPKFLKYQAWKIDYDELDFLSILNLIFTACVLCSLQKQTECRYVMCSPSTLTKIVYHMTRSSGNRVKRKIAIVIDSGFFCSCKKQKNKITFSYLKVFPSYCSTTEKKMHFLGFCFNSNQGLDFPFVNPICTTFFCIIEFRSFYLH